MFRRTRKHWHNNNAIRNTGNLNRHVRSVNQSTACFQLMSGTAMAIHDVGQKEAEACTVHKQKATAASKPNWRCNFSNRGVMAATSTVKIWFIALYVARTSKRGEIRFGFGSVGGAEVYG